MSIVCQNKKNGLYNLYSSSKIKDFLNIYTISFEYLTEEKFYPPDTSNKYFASSCKQYPVTIRGHTLILTNGGPAAALISLPEKREIIYLYFFGNYTPQETGNIYGHCKSTAWHYKHSALQMLREEMEVLLHQET